MNQLHLLTSVAYSVQVTARQCHGNFSMFRASCVVLVEAWSYSWVYGQFVLLRRAFCFCGETAVTALIHTHCRVPLLLSHTARSGVRKQAG